jgi:hypothetical protein
MPTELFEPLETMQFREHKAWKIDFKAKIVSLGDDPALDGGIAGWIIQAPWAHPVWNSYWLHVVHLRSIDRGGKTA